MRCLGVVPTGSFAALALPVASYFREPAVAAIVAALSLTFVFDAVQVVPRALLQWDLRFRTLAWLHGLQVTIAAIVVAGAATLRLGHWALVLNTLVSGAIITGTLYALRPFQVDWPRQFGQIAGSLAAGWRMLVSCGPWYGYSSLDPALIGRMLGKEALGIFGFAMTFASLPVTEVSSMVSKVVPRVFSSVQDRPPRLRRYFLLLTETASYITLPVSVGLALTAEDFILLALGPKWVDVDPAAADPVALHGLQRLPDASVPRAAVDRPFPRQHVAQHPGPGRAAHGLLHRPPLGRARRGVGLGHRVPDQRGPRRIPHGPDPGRAAPGLSSTPPSPRSSLASS